MLTLIIYSLLNVVLGNGVLQLFLLLAHFFTTYLQLQQWVFFLLALLHHQPSTSTMDVLAPQTLLHRLPSTSTMAVLAPSAHFFTTYLQLRQWVFLLLAHFFTT